MIDRGHDLPWGLWSHCGHGYSPNTKTQAPSQMPGPQAASMSERPLGSPRGGLLPAVKPQSKAKKRPSMPSFPASGLILSQSDRKSSHSLHGKPHSQECPLSLCPSLASQGPTAQAHHTDIPHHPFPSISAKEARFGSPLLLGPVVLYVLITFLSHLP